MAGPTSQRIFEARGFALVPQDEKDSLGSTPESTPLVKKQRSPLMRNWISLQSTANTDCSPHGRKRRDGKIPPHSYGSISSRARILDSTPTRVSRSRIVNERLSARREAYCPLIPRRFERSSRSQTSSRQVKSNIMYWCDTLPVCACYA